jgi:hypothetical protein
VAGIIEDPARFVPLMALSFGSEGAPAILVDGDHPLPTVRLMQSASSTPLAGEATASGIFGPFVPDTGLPIWLSLSGSWTGSVQLLRSVDGGATKLPLTIAGQPWASFTGSGHEVVAQECSHEASYWLAVTIVSGALAYRVSQ